jgi:hypothetical protein
MIEAYRERMGQDIGVSIDASFVDPLFSDDPDDPITGSEEYSELIPDHMDHLEADPAYAGYAARRSEFISRQSDDWRYRFGI